MKEALVNGGCVFFAVLGGYLAGEVLTRVIAWEVMAMIAGGIITVITAAAALTAVQLHNMAGVYKRAAGRLEDDR